VIFRSEGAEFFGVLSIAFSYTSPKPARGALAKAVEIAAFLKNCRLEVGLAIECELRFAKKLGYEPPALSPWIYQVRVFNNSWICSFGTGN
jgi:hypothetical protein